ncbi:Uncharacterised protein [Neisseria animaloris]|nr:Uncharacterised protein [Neisseria animaloris]
MALPYVRSRLNIFFQTASLEFPTLILLQAVDHTVYTGGCGQFV